jgi:tetratricopeptide (TPR) repeat protein
MTDDKKQPPGNPLEDENLDWDKALSEWDEESFAPEVAKDIDTHKPAALAGNVPKRPLFYRPPSLPTGAATAKPKPPPAPPAPASPAARPPEPPYLGEAEDDEGATKVARLPPEFRAARDLSKFRSQAVPKAPQSKPSRGGGLGQLFSREGGGSSERRDVPVDGSFDARARTPASGKLPSSEPSGEKLPSVAIEAFDPFAEPPPPRSAQPTRPAEEELGELISAAPESSAPPSDAQTRRGESLIVPEERQYDPEEETAIGKLPANVQDMRAVLEAAIERQRQARVAKEAGQPEAPPLPGPPLSEDTRRLTTESAPQPKDPSPAEPEPEEEKPAQGTSWQDERPASGWLSEAAREGLTARAAWLEEEARALPDKISMARGLLACSEILATTGDLERAHALASEARDLAPSLALAHRQARGLMPGPVDEAALIAALEAEVRVTPVGPARTHSTLLIAELLQAGGSADEAAKRFEQAARASTADVRPALARAARALARGELTNVALRIPAAGPLGALAGAVGAALRLRGVERDGRSPASPAPGQMKDDAGDEPGPSELGLKIRQALEKGNVSASIGLVAQLGRVPELAPASLWLSAALAAPRAATRPEAARWLGELAQGGDLEARRALLARALEMDDVRAVQEALDAEGAFSPAERVVASTLAGIAVAADDPRVEALAATPGMEALAASVAAIAGAQGGGSLRAARTAGAPEARARVRLGRLLATPGMQSEAEATARALGDAAPPSARAVGLEIAFRERRASEVSATVEAWGSAATSPEERAQGALAAALVAERAGDVPRALEAFRAARAGDPTNEAVVRAIAALAGEDLAHGLTGLADALHDGVRASMARVEAVTRAANMPDTERVELLDRAHRAAPALSLAAFLGESAGRSEGNLEEVLRWLRERRAATTDPVEAAFESLREALLLLGRDRAAAGERLLEAHRARPADVALRLLCERFAAEPMEDNAAWRESRASEATGETRTLWYLEAAHEYDRVGDEESALRCSAAAAAEGDPLGHVARERSELRAGNVARLADELLALAKTTDDPRSKRESYERLAMLDATARQDPASALLWHRAILEEELPDSQPSLRHVEQYLVGEGRDDELEPVASAIARSLRGTGPGEATSHAELAARLRMRSAEGSWESSREMVEIAASEGEATLWALRMLRAHARASGDDQVFLDVTQRLIESTSPRPAEASVLLTRAGETAMRLGKLEDARRLLERATLEDSGDVSAWSLLAQVRQRGGDAAGAAEAYEALARTSVVPERQLQAWHDAGRLWQDEVRAEPRALAALEAAAAIDVAYGDLFDRLSTLYARSMMQAELAALLERRVAGISDPAERLAMEVRRGRALLEVGDVEGARRAFEAALADRPDDIGALSAFADLCMGQKDWQAAEEALVRLARLLPAPEQQRDTYLRLGELYTHRSPNLSRAEVAFKEVLKRTPEDVATIEKLVEVYRRQSDVGRAAELQQELVKLAATPEDKRRRLIELAFIHEQTGHDNRKAEQTLEGARREFPQDVAILRALAEFYVRHQQTPAVNILLDRAGADARRALAAGRFSTSAFEILGLVFEVRGKRDAAQSTQAMLAALEGRPAEIRAAGERALDPRLDELLAPEVLTPAMRALLAKTGEALDVASPVDLKTLKAAPAPADGPLARLATTVGHTLGLGTVQVLVSSKLGPTCMPVGSTPPTLLLGEALLAPERERTGRFLVLRALKLVRAKAAALARTTPAELAVLVSAWLKCFNPTWQPQGINAAALNAAGGRVQAALPKNRDPDVDLLALEVAGTLGTQATTLAANSLMWANRAALLATGNPNDAIDAVASAAGLANGAPRDPKERAAWLARTQEARDILIFGVTDAFAEARARLGIDR